MFSDSRVEKQQADFVFVSTPRPAGRALLRVCRGGSALSTVRWSAAGGLLVLQLCCFVFGLFILGSLLRLRTNEYVTLSETLMGECNSAASA